MEQKFTASLSRSQEREGWCIIFRHPVRIGKDGKVGLRVRRGLGTKDKAEAEQLVEQTNRILGDETYWTLSAKPRAEREEFDSRIVSIFYDSMEPIHYDHLKNREDIIPMPGREKGYVRVMFMGTTGAGKTTLLRQFIGSDPEQDRFPSTSAAKTTTCDIEVIMEEGPYYRAVVSFLPRDHVRHCIDECVSSAVLACVEDAKREEMARRFLTHREQRFRLSYLLGTPSASEQDYLDDEEDNEESISLGSSTGSEVSESERKAMATRLDGYLNGIEALARIANNSVKIELNEDEFTGEDKDAFKEIVAEFVEGKLYESEDFHTLVDEMLDDVERRFDLLEIGTYRYDRSGWPITWTFETADREEFIRRVNRFSSNYALNFGRLLTPIVQGIRVSGPFKPIWGDGEIPPLVLMDGEGLGHTPDSTASLPTEVTRRFGMVDTILLVDHAVQPLQAAASAALRSIASRGHEAKLFFVFTHFDEVRGDNFTGIQERQNHLRNSLDNCLSGIGNSMGKDLEKSLRRHLSDKVFFLSRMQSPVGDKAQRTREELKKLLQKIETMIAAPMEERKVIPIYDMAHLSICVHNATQEFHDPWEARLGLIYRAGISKEHWTRIKALSRRFAERWGDEYDNLRPVADLTNFLVSHIRNFLNTPLDWKPQNVSEEEKQAAIARVAQEVSDRLQGYVSKRLYEEPEKQWSDAYTHRGYGSTRSRSRGIKSIYVSAAPIPGEAPTPEGNIYLREVIALVREAVEKAGAKVAQ